MMMAAIALAGRCWLRGCRLDVQVHPPQGLAASVTYLPRSTTACFRSSCHAVLVASPNSLTSERSLTKHLDTTATWISDLKTPDFFRPVACRLRSQAFSKIRQMVAEREKNACPSHCRGGQPRVGFEKRSPASLPAASPAIISSPETARQRTSGSPASHLKPGSAEPGVFAAARLCEPRPAARIPGLATCRTEHCQLMTAHDPLGSAPMPKPLPNHRRYLESLVVLGPAGRLQKALKLSEAKRQAYWRHLAASHPDRSETELRPLFTADLLSGAFANRDDEKRA